MAALCFVNITAFFENNIYKTELESWKKYFWENITWYLKQKMLESIEKGNLWLCIIVVVCMAETNNQQGYKTSIQHRNREKYETIVEEIRLQPHSGNVAFIF